MNTRPGFSTVPKSYQTLRTSCAEPALSASGPVSLAACSARSGMVSSHEVKNCAFSGSALGAARVERPTSSVVDMVLPRRGGTTTISNSVVSLGSGVNLVTAEAPVPDPRVAPGKPARPADRLAARPSLAAALVWVLGEGFRHTRQPIEQMVRPF